jgi:hypothetical protein
MISKSTWIVAAALVAASLPAEAQFRGPNRGARIDVARAQGVPPGHLPPANQCRVWYDNRPNGQQPSPVNCRQAEAIAARDRNARVIYGQSVYSDARDTNYGYPDNDRAVRRGSVRDPRYNNGEYYGDYGRGSRYYLNSPAFQNGYRDGMTKGREDGEDRDRYDASRHNWYRSANRGYESRYGARSNYQELYRQGFDTGYAEGYRVYARR